jgi:hypothetical protein
MEGYSRVPGWKDCFEWSKSGMEAAGFISKKANGTKG